MKEVTKHTGPYEAFRGTHVWEVVEDAVDDLVKNNDLIEQTNRDYIVGYICKKLQQAGVWR